MTLLSFGGL
jgi:glycosyltransferase involved in cell wall biosynthesis